MSELPPQTFIVHNQSELEDLAWELESAEGQFSLMLARCNYARLRDELVEHLRQICSVVIRVLVLQPSEAALYARIQSELKGEHPRALMVFGLETVADLEQLLANANQVREEFRKNCPFPIVLWVTDEVMKGLVHAAPDLESWSTKTHLTLPLETLSQTLQQAADCLFDNLLDPAAKDAFDISRRTLDLGFLHSSEVESATQDLRLQGQEITPTLQASLDFAEGLNAINSVEALASFERSLQFWQAQESKDVGRILSLKIGLLLVYIGRVKFEIVESALPQIPDWGTIRQNLQQAIARFDQANRSDLVALCVPQLERVLQKLQAWDELAATARKGLELHQVYGTQTRLSQDYGFLARVMLEQQQWGSAQQAAQQALIELTAEPEDLNWLRGLYRLFLAQAARQLENPEAAIEHLKEANAREVSDRGYPKIAIRILQELRTLHFDRKQYLEAFEAKQERLSIEQQYGIRAFVGAGRLQPQRQEVVAEFQAPTEGMVAPEIAAAGRQRDLERLVERVERRDYRLIVIHGNSGVGKSSLINAGLVPTLRQKTIDARNNVPIVVRVYTQWIQELGRLLNNELRGQKLEETQSSKLKAQNLLVPLQQLDQLNLRTVLIFDQFEEFFFVYPKSEDRKPFFEFLAQCLQILSVKVFLSLREDYIHYLLECNRIEDIKQTGIDVLSRNVLYELGNFSRQDAQATIQSLTTRAHFYLESKLVEKLVEDLAKELGTVRPIELQVVGAQLQQDGIITLEQYLNRGPKEELIRRYLLEVVDDCGEENKQISELVLYLLTDEQGTRPLKTFSELERELELLSAVLVEELDKLNLVLDLVLKVFVGSGLVSLLPEIPADRYQLVHDYLASFIRQWRSQPILEELSVLRQQNEQLRRDALQTDLKRVQRERENVEKELTLEKEAKKALENAHRKGKQRIRIGSAVLALTIAISGLTYAFLQQTNEDIQLERDGINALRQFDSQQLEALLSAMHTGQKMKYMKNNFLSDKYPATSPILALQKILDAIKEKNQFRGHKDSVNKVRFDPDGKRIVTASSDGTARVWALSGEQLYTLKGHQDKVNDAIFSHDGRFVLTASSDATARLWDLQAKRVVILKGHAGAVNTAVFSPNGKFILTTSLDNTARLWDLNGHQIAKPLRHDGSLTVATFNQDGTRILTASWDKTARLWDLSGNQITEFKGHEDGIVNASFSQDGKYILTASLDKTARLWNLSNGQLLTILKGHEDRVVAARFIKFDNDKRDGNLPLILTASWDNTTRIWNFSGNQIEILRGHQSRINSLDVNSNNNRQIVTASLDSTSRLWDLSEQRQSINLSKHSDRVTSISFSPDGKRIVTASLDNTARLWDFSGRELLSLQKHSGSVEKAKFSPDGGRVLTASWDYTARLWDSFSGKELAILSGHQDRVTDASFSPDDKQIVTVSMDNTARLWSVSNTANNLSGTSEGKIITSIKTILPDSSSNSTVSASFRSNGQRIYNIASFSPDSRLILVSLGNNLPSVLDSSGKQLFQLKGHTGKVFSASFSPDSQHILTASLDDTIRLWDLQGHEQSKTNQGNIISASFSPQGHYILAAYADNTARLWDRSLKKVIASFTGSQGIDTAIFSPDEQHILTVSSDNTSRIWDVSGRRLGEFQGRSLNFSPDGNFIFIAAANGDVQLWQFNDLSQLLTRGCNFLSNYLKSNTLSEYDREVCKTENSHS